MIWLVSLLCLVAIGAASYAVWFTRGELAAQERLNEIILGKINSLKSNEKSIHVVLVNHKQHIDQIYELLALDDGCYLAFDESYTKMEQ